ncbi:hypothetical protein BCR39DRAFT_100177 [Naematelia encephala]|uniref:Fe2OG dioxygenase domain-containing protein n=1 Tax=Naematelia encephala TaxID=71784 RepID=A0A1Y2B829_9TREE|nr:hypothetical protein BCR39DRAFT_100177 [Naematelia encephala]
MLFGLSAFPSHLERLLTTLNDLVASRVPLEVFEQPLARQAILNLYPPGNGISPHIDLPHRYADGILGVSLCGGCVIDFSKEREQASKRGDEAYSVYLPPRSVYVLTGEARWQWAHGIEGRTHDIVLDDQGVKQTVQRGLRVSVTFRWMKEGGEVLS